MRCMIVMKFSLSFSLVEVYKETVLDLLEKHSVLSIRESTDHLFFVNAKQLSFESFSEFSKVDSVRL